MWRKQSFESAPKAEVNFAPTRPTVEDLVSGASPHYICEVELR